MNWSVRVSLIIYFIVAFLFQHIYNVMTGYSGGGLAAVVFTLLVKLDTRVSLLGKD